jgi:hypothetical protein
MKRLKRRTLLRGMCAGIGAAVALPPLDIMFDDNGTAYAGGEAIPIRYGTFFWGNGNRPDRWRPRRMGAEWWSDPNEELAPIAASALVRDYVTVLSDFDLQQGGAGHHTGRAQVLTGTYDEGRGTYGNPTGPSTDFIIASAWEGLTRFRNLDVAISETGKANSDAEGQSSVDAGGNFAGAEFSPRRVYERLFSAGVEPGTMAAVQLAEVRQSMVDVVRADAERLRRRLGVVDQRRLESHLDGIRNIERSLAGLEVNRCEAPAMPGDGYTEDRSHELLEEKNRVMADLVAMAFACDLTRVMTYQFTPMQSDCLFWQVGAEQGSHVLTHDDRGLPEELAPQYERVHQVTTFIMQNFTALLEALARVPEGDGNVLHNSVILATSELSDGTSHDYGDIPLLIAGRAGGRLARGSHLSGGNDNFSKVPLTILNTLGVSVDGFGANASRATDTFGALLA